MPDRTASGPVDSAAVIREAVSIHTRKIFDSCRDKDCVDDLRVYPTVSSQTYIESALSLRPRAAELLYIAVSVEPISFNRGYYTVDCTHFYRVTGEAFPSGDSVQGLAIFDKRVMLFGSEGSSKSFASDDRGPAVVTDDLPVAVVNSVNPIALHMKLVDADAALPPENEQRQIPDLIAAAFPEPLVLTDTARRWYTTIGQFSIVRLERPTQLVIPVYDYGLPQKECPGNSEGDPCELFSRIPFPVEEFFPPNSVNSSEAYRDMV